MILELYVSLLVAVPIFLGMDALVRRSSTLKDPQPHSWSKHPRYSWVRDHLPVQNSHHIR